MSKNLWDLVSGLLFGIKCSCIYYLQMNVCNEHRSVWKATSRDHLYATIDLLWEIVILQHRFQAHNNSQPLQGVVQTYCSYLAVRCCVSGFLIVKSELGVH